MTIIKLKNEIFLEKMKQKVDKISLQLYIITIKKRGMHEILYKMYMWGKCITCETSQK